MYASICECGAAQPDTAGPETPGPGEARSGGADFAAGIGPEVGRGGHEFATRRIRECEARVRAALAEQLRWVAEIARQGSYAQDGARSTRVWLRELLNLADGEAATRVRVAEAVRDRIAVSGAPLDPVFPATGEAVRSGTMSLEHARVIVDGVEKLPPTATDTDRDMAERTLVEQARTLSPRQVRTLAERIRYVLDQDGAPRDEEHQYAARELRWGTGRDGMIVVRGRLDRVAGARLSAVLESLAAPRPAADGEKDPRSAGQRNADALTQALEIVLGSDRLPRAGGARPRLTVTIDYRQLRTELIHHAATTNHQAASDDHGIAAHGYAAPDGRCRPARGGQIATADGHVASAGSQTAMAGERVARSDWARSLPGLGMLDNTGQPVTAACVRRLACDAEILPIVLGGESQPLDIGRQRRTAPSHLRAALLARDGACSFPGCDQPPGTSEAHHVVHWMDGGRTSLDNMTMLCGHHHRTIHAHGWDVTLQRGRPTFIPPVWIDPTRTPRPGMAAAGIPPPRPTNTELEPDWPEVA